MPPGHPNLVHVRVYFHSSLDTALARHHVTAAAHIIQSRAPVSVYYTSCRPSPATGGLAGLLWPPESSAEPATSCCGAVRAAHGGRAAGEWKERPQTLCAERAAGAPLGGTGASSCLAAALVTSCVPIKPTAAEIGSCNFFLRHPACRPCPCSRLTAPQSPSQTPTASVCRPPPPLLLPETPAMDTGLIPPSTTPRDSPDAQPPASYVPHAWLPFSVPAFSRTTRTQPLRDCPRDSSSARGQEPCPTSRHNPRASPQWTNCSRHESRPSMLPRGLSPSW